MLCVGGLLLIDKQSCYKLNALLVLFMAVPRNAIFDSVRCTNIGVQ